MALTMGGVALDDKIMPPKITDIYRARSIVYALDGTAREDRLGAAKKHIAVTFGILSASVWEQIKAALALKEIKLSGYVGSMSVTGDYRLIGDIPTPVLYVEGGRYVTSAVGVELEEI